VGPVTVSAGSCEIVAMTITVVLNGTSGAGKTSMAEAIRALSPRNKFARSSPLPAA